MSSSLISFVILIADVYALYNVITSRATTGVKILWSLVILLLPVLGFIAWFVAGPKSQN